MFYKKCKPPLCVQTLYLAATGVLVGLTVIETLVLSLLNITKAPNFSWGLPDVIFVNFKYNYVYLCITKSLFHSF